MKMNLSSLKPVALPKAAPVKEKENSVNLLTQNKSVKRGRPSGAIKAADKLMIGFRVTKSQKREIQQLALDLDVSVSDLLLRALDHYKQTLRVR